MPGYTLPDGVTLKNKLGATTSAALDHLETPIIEGRLIELQFGLGPLGQFDLEHLKALHRHIFQDVYEWAGRTRNEKVRLADGSAAHEPIMRKVGGRNFTEGALVTNRLNAIFRQLAEDDFLRGLDRDAFAAQAAIVLSEINSAHPFRDGNGRTQRSFMAALARQSGHELRFDVISRQRMYRVSVASHEQGDHRGFQRMIREVIDPDRVAALAEAQAFLDRHSDRLDWRDIYMATTEEGQTYSLAMVGIAGPNFMGRTANEILVGRSRDLPDPPPAAGETFTMTAAPRE